jgi:hypothetical protein
VRAGWLVLQVVNAAPESLRRFEISFLRDFSATFQLKIDTSFQTELLRNKVVGSKFVGHFILGQSLGSRFAVSACLGPPALYFWLPWRARAWRRALPWAVRS